MNRLIIFLAACGGGGSNTDKPAIDAPDNPQIDAAIDAPMQTTFTLTSPAFAQGATIPTVHTCGGANTSPQLVWTAGPAGTMSYAIVFTDKNNGLIHSVIYDIPGSATGLPANVQKAYMPTNVVGAKQTLAYNNQTRGYLGPCPPNLHTYEFVVYALGVATLPGATMATDRAGAKTIIEMNDLSMAALSGTYGP
jgi:Raf kinase inhibitor-like YbhB/YbcL family protein